MSYDNFDNKFRRAARLANKLADHDEGRSHGSHVANHNTHGPRGRSALRRERAWSHADLTHWIDQTREEN